MPDDDELRPERIFTDLLDFAEAHNIEVDTEIHVGHPARDDCDLQRDTRYRRNCDGKPWPGAGITNLEGRIAERVLRRAPSCHGCPSSTTDGVNHRESWNTRISTARRRRISSAASIRIPLFGLSRHRNNRPHAIDPMETHYGEGHIGPAKLSTNKYDRGIAGRRRRP